MTQTVRFQRVFILLLFSCFLHSASAQVKKGDFYFKKFEYGLALEAYSFAYHEQNEQNPYLLRKIALTHRRLGNMTESAEWYKRTTHRDQSNPEDFLFYAEALKYIKDYKESKKFYKKYKKKVPGDRRAILHLENPNYVEELHRDSVHFSVKRLGMSTDKPEFGITRYDEGFLFSATGVINPELGNEFFSDGELKNKYLDVYTATVIADNELKLGGRLPAVVNSEFHDGPVCFDHVNQELIITRNNVVKDKPVLDSKGKVNLKLYVSKRIDGVFQPAVALPFNSDAFSNAHPAISPDGKRLYFASNRDGGHGETDIWYAERVGDGWTQPKNIGTSINTEGDETFPFIEEDGTLYFSSTGHAGLGGIDIFQSQNRNGDWMKPTNLGAPLNSNKDDFGIVTSDGGKNGYFSSNRHSHTIDDDIYHFTHDPNIHVRALVQDETTLKPIAGAIGRLYDMDDNLLAETKSDIDGYIEFKIVPKKCDYRVEIGNGDGYSIENRDINYCDKRQSLYDFGSVGIGEMRYVALGTIRDTVTDQAIPNFICTLYDATNGGKILEKKTRNDGMVRFSLKPDMDYKMTLQKEGWFAKSAKFSTKGMDPGTIEIEKYVNMAFEQIVIDKPVEVKNIYYDLDKYFVREDAKPELDKLVKMMEDNPTVVIELSSHTDSQGADKYNYALSDNRAKTAAGYIVAMGIEVSRIQAKGYGESKLRNKCKNGIPCADELHEANRRTEFKVLDF